MTKKAKVLTAILVPFAAIVIAVALRSPRWVTASRAEVDRLIDPTLLKARPSNPDAVARGERLSILLKDLTRPNLSQIRSLFNEGPVESHPQTFLHTDYENAKAVRRMAKGLASRTANNALPIDDRLATIELSALAATQMLQGARGTLETTCDLSTLAILEKSIREFIATTNLTLAQQTRLLSALPNVDQLTGLEPAIIDDFQSQIYPLLPDPRVLIEGPMAKELRISNVNDLEGSYDALLTAKESSDACMEQIRASELPVSKISTPISDRIRGTVDSIPSGPNPKRKGLSLWWGIQVFRYEAAKIPNSFGYLIVPITEMQGLVTMRDDIRAWDRLIRLQLACQRYGSVPKNLETLVSAGLIPSIPTDPFDRRPMKFDPKRRLLWSIGRDGIDDHGSERKSPQLPSDLVMHLK